MASTELYFEAPDFLFMHAGYIAQLEMTEQPLEVLFDEDADTAEVGVIA